MRHPQKFQHVQQALSVAVMVVAEMMVKKMMVQKKVVPKKVVPQQTFSTRDPPSTDFTGQLERRDPEFPRLETVFHLRVRNTTNQ